MVSGVRERMKYLVITISKIYENPYQQVHILLKYVYYNKCQAKHYHSNKSLVWQLQWATFMAEVAKKKKKKKWCLSFMVEVGWSRNGWLI